MSLCFVGLSIARLRFCLFPLLLASWSPPFLLAYFCTLSWYTCSLFTCFLAHLPRYSWLTSHFLACSLNYLLFVTLRVEWLFGSFSWRLIPLLSCTISIHFSKFFAFFLIVSTFQLFIVWITLVFLIIREICAFHLWQLFPLFFYFAHVRSGQFFFIHLTDYFVVLCDRVTHWRSIIGTANSRTRWNADAFAVIFREISFNFNSTRNLHVFVSFLLYVHCLL